MHACLPTSAAGTCRSGRCTCTTDNHCPPDQYCLPAAPADRSSLGACRPLKIFNQACSSSRECFTRLCLKGVCKDCTSNKDCVRATCNTTTNACSDSEWPPCVVCQWLFRVQHNCHD